MMMMLLMLETYEDKGDLFLSTRVRLYFKLFVKRFFVLKRENKTNKQIDKRGYVAVSLCCCKIVTNVLKCRHQHRY